MNIEFQARTLEMEITADELARQFNEYGGFTITDLLDAYMDYGYGDDRFVKEILQWAEKNTSK